MSSTLKWVCQAGRGLNRVTGSGDTDTLVENFSILKGTIDLEPNLHFWYLYATLKTVDGGNSQAGTEANVFVRHYVDSTHGPVVQASVLVKGHWDDIGDPSAAFSTTGASGKSGGINLVAFLD